jgi:xylulokinase
VIKEPHILAIDHGTSGVKSSLVSVSGKVVATESEDVRLELEGNGKAEQDPEHWWQALLRTGRRLIESGAVDASQVKGVCVSSTFSSTVVVDKNGDALMNAIMWLDTRGAPYVERIFGGGFPSLEGYRLSRAIKWLRKTGGLPTLSGKDDLAHALLVKHEFPEIYAKTHKFLPSKDYFNLRLTGECAASFDSVTLFWLSNTQDINNVHYDPGLAKAVGLELDKLPELKASTDVLGPVLPDVARELGIPEGTPVVVGSPDHQGAGIGSGAVRDFDAHLYIGTSSWIQCTVPFKKTDIFHSIASLPTAIPGKYYCANEQDLAGGCLGFLLNSVLFAGSELTGTAPDDAYPKLDAAAGRAPAGSGNVIFTPWLNGERSPVDDDTVRGGFFNLSTTTTQDHLVRAVMEGVALNTRWNLKYVEKFIGKKLKHLRLIGGGALSDTWCQILADVMQIEIRRVEDPRAANARGAAMIALAGLKVASFEEVGDKVGFDRTFEPNTEHAAIYDRLFEEFLRLYRNNKAMHKRLQLAGNR